MLVELKRKEFDAFAQTHIYNHFQQSSFWAKFMEPEGWHAYFLGYKENEKEPIKAATLLLSQNTALGHKRYFYAPRGFLIDYKNVTLLEAFTEEILKFVKEKKGVYLKIDPYVLWRQRDQDGEIKKGGLDNTNIVMHLEKLGFLHVGNDLKKNMIQPRWLYIIDTRGKEIAQLEKEMRDKARQIVHRNEREGIHFRFLSIEELPQFVAIMKTVSQKYHTLEYTTHYYEDLFAAFPEETRKMAVVELHPKEAIKALDGQLAEVKMHYYEKAFQKDTVLKMNEETFQKDEKKQEMRILQLEEKKKAYEAILQERGDTILLGGYFILLYGNEVTALHGGILEEWKSLDALTTLHYEMLKYTKENGFDRYNLYEISGNFQENSPMYGSYLFKKNFGGEVIELIGEFDYVLDKTTYPIFKHFFPHYYGIKVIRKK